MESLLEAFPFKVGAIAQNNSKHFSQRINLNAPSPSKIGGHQQSPQPERIGAATLSTNGSRTTL